MNFQTAAVESGGQEHGALVQQILELLTTQVSQVTIDKVLTINLQFVTDKY